MPLRKRRKANVNIEQISFDPKARAEYLTGFHKRKLQRAKQAQDIAAKKAKEDKIEFRRKVCL
jgi:ribosomal RNA-processing protein 17